MRVKKSGLLLIKVLRLIFKFGLFALNIIVAIASEDRSKPRHTAISAQHLHDEDLISDIEHADSIYSGK